MLLGNPERGGEADAGDAARWRRRRASIGSRVRVLDRRRQAARQRSTSRGGDGRGGQAPPLARFALEPGTYRVEVRCQLRREARPRRSSSPARHVRGVIDEQTPKVDERRMHRDAERQKESATRSRRASLTTDFVCVRSASLCLCRCRCRRRAVVHLPRQPAAHRQHRRQAGPGDAARCCGRIKSKEHFVASPVPLGDRLFVSGLGAFNVADLLLPRRRPEGREARRLDARRRRT